jgi:hypothetical protein
MTNYASRLNKLIVRKNLIKNQFRNLQVFFLALKPLKDFIVSNEQKSKKKQFSKE